MKKIFILIPICLMFILGIESKVSASDIQIPNEAIRFRVIANSNSTYDQEVKFSVSNEVQKSLYEMLKNSNSISESRKIIQDNLDTLSNSVEKVFAEKEYIGTYKINFGYNYFPEKTYKGVKYEAGDYESLKITIGSGEGNNFWCVLFPPLCLVEAEESDETEYKFFVSELIDKYF